MMEAILEVLWYFIVIGAGIASIVAAAIAVVIALMMVACFICNFISPEDKP